MSLSPTVVLWAGVVLLVCIGIITVGSLTGWIPIGEDNKKRLIAGVVTVATAAMGVFGASLQGLNKEVQGPVLLGLKEVQGPVLQGLEDRVRKLELANNNNQRFNPVQRVDHRDSYQ